MINRLLLLTACIALSGVLKAQEWEKQAFINTQFYFINHAKRLMIRPGVEISKGYHHLRAAPSFRLLSTEAGYEPSDFQITGGMAAYQFSVPTEIEFLHFYFQYELNYHLFRNDWRSNFYNPDERMYEVIVYETHENFISQSLGIGFEVFLGQRFSLAIDVSEGYYFSDIQVKNLPSDLQQVENFDFREYGDQGWVLSTSFSIAYNF